MSFSTCRHVKENGVFCDSPALKGRELCYFHLRARGARVRAAQQAALSSSGVIDLPLLEDAFALQAALQRVLEAFAADRIDRRRAGTMLYGLHLASRNLKHIAELQQSQAGDTEICDEYPTYEQEFGLGEFAHPGPSPEELAVIKARRHLKQLCELADHKLDQGWLPSPEWQRRELMEAEWAVRSLHLALARLRDWEALHGTSRYAGPPSDMSLPQAGTPEGGYFSLVRERYPVAPGPPSRVAPHTAPFVPPFEEMAHPENCDDSRGETEPVKPMKAEASHAPEVASTSHPAEPGSPGDQRLDVSNKKNPRNVASAAVPQEAKAAH